ncbi:MAG: hypothetical protein WC980_00150 [Candidatus Brocadiia bacterium]
MPAKTTIVFPGQSLPTPFKQIILVISILVSLVFIFITLPLLIIGSKKDQKKKIKKYCFKPENSCLSVLNKYENNEIHFVGNRDGLLEMKAEVDDFASGDFKAPDHWHLEDSFKGVDIVFSMSDKSIFEWYKNEDYNDIEGAAANWRQVSECIDRAIEKGQCSVELPIKKGEIINKGSLVIRFDDGLKLDDNFVSDNRSKSKSAYKTIQRYSSKQAKIESWIIEIIVVLWISFAFIKFSGDGSIWQTLGFALILIVVVEFVKRIFK